MIKQMDKPPTPHAVVFLRVPLHVHTALQRAALERKTSVNQFAIAELSRATQIHTPEIVGKNELPTLRLAARARSNSNTQPNLTKTLKRKGMSYAPDHTRNG